MPHFKCYWMVLDIRSVKLMLGEILNTVGYGRDIMKNTNEVFIYVFRIDKNGMSFFSYFFSNSEKGYF